MQADRHRLYSHAQSLLYTNGVFIIRSICTGFYKTSDSKRFLCTVFQYSLAFTLRSQLGRVCEFLKPD
jgi:hypothetical protein